MYVFIYKVLSGLKHVSVSVVLLSSFSVICHFVSEDQRKTDFLENS